MTQLALAFALTVASEGLVAAAILRRWVWRDAALIQLATWPAAIVLCWLMRAQCGLALVEVPVFLAEIFLWRALQPISWLRATVLSLVANGVSFGIGLWLFYWT